MALRLVFAVALAVLAVVWGLRALYRLRCRGDLNGAARLPHGNEELVAPAPSLRILPSPTFDSQRGLAEAEAEHRATLRAWADRLAQMDGNFPLASDLPPGVDAEERRGAALFLLSATFGGIPRPQEDVDQY